MGTVLRPIGRDVRLRDLAAAGRHSEVLAVVRGALVDPSSSPAASAALLLPSALLSAASLSLPLAAAQLHVLALKCGLFPSDHYVLSALISAYSRLRRFPLALRLFDSVPPSAAPTTAFNALLSGHALNSPPSAAPLALSLFRTMRRDAVPFDDVTLLALLPAVPLLAVPSLHATAFRASLSCISSVANCFLTCYAKLGDVDAARRLFEEMPDGRKDLVTWNAMISCYAQNGLAQSVLDVYYDMERSSFAEPDAVTLVGVLSACAHLGAGSVGQKIEEFIAQKPSLASNIYLKNGLINLHVRCGNLVRAQKIFDGMHQRSIVSWTAMITGYGMHGHGDLALLLFDRMIEDGIRPDGVAMVSILSACSHAGMTDKGIEYFSSMEATYGVTPKPEHYACMVDLLGRAGRLQDALELVISMPTKPDGPVWGALLGACKIHKDVEMGKLAFEHVIELEPMNVGYYVLLSNIYSDAGMLDDVARIRTMMKKRGLRKDPGCSYFELKGKVHLFMADDHSHPQVKRIYEMVKTLEAFVQGNNKIDEKKNAPLTGVHSEKLAIAFAMLNTEVGEEIVIIKNLRVCDDCHQFTKVVSDIVNRKFVVRDASRFHHFEGGCCSCKNYW